MQLVLSLDLLGLIGGSTVRYGHLPCNVPNAEMVRDTAEQEVAKRPALL